MGSIVRALGALFVASSLSLLTPARASAQDAPRAVAPAADARVSLAPDRPPSGQLVVDGVVAGVAGAVIAVPTSIGLANAMTHLSPDLLGGGIPALLFLGFAAPFAVNGMSVVAMNLHEPGRYNVWPSILATLPVHWGALAVGAVTGVWYGNVANLALFTLVESVLLPATAVSFALLTRRRPPARPSRSASRAGAVLEDRAPLARASLDARSISLTPTPALVAPLFSVRF
jgi:hypothetical protein